MTLSPIQGQRLLRAERQPQKALAVHSRRCRLRAASDILASELYVSSYRDAMLQSL